MGVSLGWRARAREHFFLKRVRKLPCEKTPFLEAAVLTSQSGQNQIKNNTYQMKMNTPLMHRIQSLDLEPIKYKLMLEQQWTLARVDALEPLYKMFLYLCIEGHAVPPTKELDEMWHCHMLDTRKYAEDCQQLCGRFLHHFPYFGLLGEAENEKLHAAAGERNRLYREIFNTDLEAVSTAWPCNNPPGCHSPEAALSAATVWPCNNPPGCHSPESAPRATISVWPCNNPPGCHSPESAVSREKRPTRRDVEALSAV